MTALPPLSELADDVERLYCTVVEDRVDARRISNALRDHATLTRAPLLGEDARDAAIDAMCRTVAANAGENFDGLDKFTKQVLRDTQRAAIEAYTAALAIPAEGDAK